jgi:hypothetical protein
LDWYRTFYPAGILRLLGRLGRGQSGISMPRWLGRFLTSLSQHAEEGKHSRMKRRLMELEE